MVVAEECTLHGLRPGSSYLLRTRAVNHMGAGAPSKPSTVLTQSSIPTGPPESLAVTSVSRGVVHLAWQPPVHDGGAAITHYQVREGPGRAVWKQRSLRLPSLDESGFLFWREFLDLKRHPCVRGRAGGVYDTTV